MDGGCSGGAHKFVWYVRTCHCGAVTVPDPAFHGRRNGTYRKPSDHEAAAHKAAERIAALAAIEKRLAEGAPTHGPARPPRASGRRGPRGGKV